MSDPLLSQEEIQRVTGGYKRAADQLRVLHSLGFYRATMGKITRRVILARAHYDSGSPDSRVERGMTMQVQKPEKRVEREMACARK